MQTSQGMRSMPSGLRFLALFTDDRGKGLPGGGDQDEGRHDEEEDRDGPGDEDRVIPLGQGEGFPQAPF